jgi:hypothetical protein
MRYGDCFQVLKEIRYLIALFIFCGAMIYLLSLFSDSRDKSYYWGNVLSITLSQGSRQRSYICNVKLDSGQTVNANCSPDQIKNSKVKLLKVQTIGNRFVYSTMYF